GFAALGKQTILYSPLESPPFHYKKLHAQPMPPSCVAWQPITADSRIKRCETQRGREGQLQIKTAARSK
ncbi:MAG: hypothetical protein AAGU23_07485, partial [Bacillota bacterium]